MVLTTTPILAFPGPVRGGPRTQALPLNPRPKREADWKILGAVFFRSSIQITRAAIISSNNRQLKFEKHLTRGVGTWGCRIQAAEPREAVGSSSV
jgi:hypothetical protein